MEHKLHSNFGEAMALSVRKQSTVFIKVTEPKNACGVAYKIMKVTNGFCQSTTYFVFNGYGHDQIVYLNGLVYDKLVFIKR